MKFGFFRSKSILKKFLIFNFLSFFVLGIFTYLYLDSIKPNLVKVRAQRHNIIINNTINHIKRLKVNFNKKSTTNFLFSNRFLFQNIERVQLFDSNLNLLADTFTLNLDEDAFIKNLDISEFSINADESQKNENNDTQILYTTGLNNKNLLKNYINTSQTNLPKTVTRNINKNFYLLTLQGVSTKNDIDGFIIISEVANDILVAVHERENFILRTAIIVALVIFIFSIFLNQSILRPIGKLVVYTNAIKQKDDKSSKLEEFLIRRDELGQLSRSIYEMTEELYKRISITEIFSSDLVHEIRNPLTSLKGASEILETTDDKEKRLKLLNIISHDVERIERLITDYSQMLKDEADLSRKKMEKINLIDVIKNVSEDFNNNNLLNLNKKIKIKIKSDSIKAEKFNVLGVESRLEQIIANLLDNAVSFSPPNSEVLILCKEINKSQLQVTVKDKGPGFNEKNINQIFKRFYSNRPEKFGEHSGLGLNIVKNIIELHKGSIKASNNTSGERGAIIDITFPVYNK